VKGGWSEGKIVGRIRYLREIHQQKIWKLLPTGKNFSGAGKGAITKRRHIRKQEKKSKRKGLRNISGLKGVGRKDQKEKKRRRKKSERLYLGRKPREKHRKDGHSRGTRKEEGAIRERGNGRKRDSKGGETKHSDTPIFAKRPGPKLEKKCVL